MCSRAEWDYLVPRVEDTIEEGPLPDCVSDAAARIDALIEEITAWACAQDEAEWFREGRRRSRPRWVV